LIDKKKPIWTMVKQVGAKIAENGGELITEGYQNGCSEALSYGGSEVNGYLCEGCTVSSVLGTDYSERNTSNKDFNSLSERSEYMLKASDIFLFLPGKIDTASDLMLVWKMAKFKRDNKEKVPIIVCFDLPWKNFISGVSKSMGLSDEDTNLINIVDSPDSLIDFFNKVL
jgi:predicted Rossmann-fold nucleotide-binding protein